MMTATIYWNTSEHKCLWNVWLVVFPSFMLWECADSGIGNCPLKWIWWSCVRSVQVLPLSCGTHISRSQRHLLIDHSYAGQHEINENKSWWKRHMTDKRSPFSCYLEGARANVWLWMNRIFLLCSSLCDWGAVNRRTGHKQVTRINREKC